VSPLLNCPCGIEIAIATCTFVPGVDGPAGVNAKVGVGSTLKGVESKSPLLPVTVTEYGFSVGSAPLETVKDVVNVPEDDTLHPPGEAIMFAGVELIMQNVSRPLYAVP
jgi:hypothetical protein